MVVAVTGIDGFLGSRVGALLAAMEGVEVLPVGRSSGYDLTRPETLAALPRFDAVLHLAAASFVPDAYKKPALFYNTNVGGTLNVLELCRQNEARMIYVSSYVYGQPHYQPIDERHPVQPFNPYAQSKAMGEQLCEAYHRDFGVPATILRPFNIYGPGQAAHFLIPKLVRQALAGETITVFDDRPRRDYVHVQDVAAALVKALEQEQPHLEVYNIGSGVSYTIPDVCRLLETLTGKTLSLQVTGEQRPNEILDTVCNHEKATRELGWQPAYTLKQGLEEMMQALIPTVAL